MSLHTKITVSQIQMTIQHSWQSVDLGLFMCLRKEQPTPCPFCHWMINQALNILKVEMKPQEK